MAPSITPGNYVFYTADNKVLNRAGIEDKSLRPKWVLLIDPRTSLDRRPLQVTEDGGKYLIKAGGGELGITPDGDLMAALIPNMGLEAAKFEFEPEGELFKIHIGDVYLCPGSQDSFGNRIKTGSKADALSFKITPA